MALAMNVSRARSLSVSVAVLAALSQIGAAPLSGSALYLSHAYAAVRSDADVAPLTDPTDVLTLLAGDPVARAIGAEAAAARLRGAPTVPVAPDARFDGELDPIIAAKISSALSILDRAPARPVAAAERFDFRAIARRARSARAGPSARRAAVPAAHVQSAILAAAQRTGTDYQYLWKAAARESAFDPHATAGTSSAYGLYQFIEETWLITVRQHGAKHGLGAYAARIGLRDGKAYVASRQDRAVILALRGDARIAAAMAGEFTRDNRHQLRAALGRDPSHGELYAAHFMGVGGAAILLREARINPTRPAASLFPTAAAKNRSIFYSQGRPRSVSSVAALLIHKGNQA
jgi:hypothetical protein